jgi:hypothetical protein
MSTAGRMAETLSPVPLQRESGHSCEWCRGTLAGKQEHWCSDACRWRAWDAANPRQRAIDWTPAAREHGAALDKRESKGQRILARLKEGPATTMELARVGGIRFGARILELRQAGHRITREDHRHAGDEWSTYTLEGSHD